MVKLTLITLGMFFLINQNSYSSDINKGQELYGRCVLCHGNNGEGKPSQNAPRIAGQYEWYILKALNDFKSGERENPQMMPYIKKLSQSDFEDLAAYISQLKLN